jgi:hypothetical protein
MLSRLRAWVSVLTSLVGVIPRALAVSRSIEQVHAALVDFMTIDQIIQQLNITLRFAGERNARVVHIIEGRYDVMVFIAGLSAVFADADAGFNALASHFDNIAPAQVRLKILFSTGGGGTPEFYMACEAAYRLVGIKALDGLEDWRSYDVTAGRKQQRI